MVAIIRHYPEKDKGIVCPISNNGSHIDEAVWHLNIRGEMAEMSFNASAYNGEALTNKGEGNTVGSLTEIQRSIVIGSLLGDGGMRCKTNALLEINHGIEQKFYVDWKYQNLAQFVLTPPKVKKGNGKRIAYRFTTRSLPELTPFYKWFYPNKKKVVPDDLLLDPLSLAVWFMDDGAKSYRALYLNTQQFDIDSQVRLVNLLNGQWGIKATLNKDKQYLRIRIAVSSVYKVKELIIPYVLTPFQYKFPL
jgi:hypothetical protein